MTAVASKLVGEEGLVVAVDVEPVLFKAGNVVSVTGMFLKQGF